MNSKQDEQKCRLLMLPAEIRNEIYRLVLVSEALDPGKYTERHERIYRKFTSASHSIVVHGWRGDNDDDAYNRIKAFLPSSDPYPVGCYLPWVIYDEKDDHIRRIGSEYSFAHVEMVREPAILQTCRKIRNEARSLYFQEHLCLDFTTNLKLRTNNLFLRWYNMQSEHLLSGIRKLRIRFEVNEYAAFKLPKGWHGWSALVRYRFDLVLDRLDVIIERDAEGTAPRVMCPVHLHENNRDVVRQLLRTTMRKDGGRVNGTSLLMLASWFQMTLEGRVSGLNELEEIADAEMGNEQGENADESLVESDIDGEEGSESGSSRDDDAAEAYTEVDNDLEENAGSEDEDDGESLGSDSSVSTDGDNEDDSGDEQNSEDDWIDEDDDEDADADAEDMLPWILCPTADDCEPMPGGRLREIRLHCREWKTIASVGWDRE